MIRLRRPPTLSVVDEPFVPRTLSLDDVDARWKALRSRNPAYYDGPLWHVAGVHRNGHGGATLHVQPCSYRFFAVQTPALDLGCRPLGVKAFTSFNGRLLIGLRSKDVAGYAACWEFAPGGTVEPGIDPAEMIVQELREETGLSVSHPPVPIAVFFDPGIRTWEIAYRLEASSSSFKCSPEHDELRWIEPAMPPAPLSDIAATMCELLHVRAPLRKGDR